MCGLGNALAACFDANKARLTFSRHRQIEFVPSRFAKEAAALFVIQRKIEFQLIRLTAFHVKSFIRHEELQILIKSGIVSRRKIYARSDAPLLVAILRILRTCGIITSSDVNSRS